MPRAARARARFSLLRLTARRVQTRIAASHARGARHARETIAASLDHLERLKRRAGEERRSILLGDMRQQARAPTAAAPLLLVAALALSAGGRAAAANENAYSNELAKGL